MDCPFCGEVCHCTPAAPVPDPCPPPPPQLQPDGSLSTKSSLAPHHVPLDPEADNGSEEILSATLHDSGRSAATDTPESLGSASYENEQTFTAASDDEVVAQAEPPLWKHQVAQRLSSYRARRKPRPPRYPSLRLKFEVADAKWHDGLYGTCPEPPRPSESTLPGSESGLVSEQNAPPEGARIIEFPHSDSASLPSADRLAEPVESPRILEAPETTPPLPGLGGIILDPEEGEPEASPEFEIPLQAAPVRHRLLAAACDGFIVTLACALFAYIFFKFVPSLSSLPQSLVLEVGISSTLWFGYQYLLLVFTGSTPGLRLACLRLCSFDGSPVNRRTRCWRVLASVLSAVSLGLGFAWCYLDEDALCWHDRITQTYLAPE